MPGSLNSFFDINITIWDIPRADEKGKSENKIFWRYHAFLLPTQLAFYDLESECTDWSHSSVVKHPSVSVPVYSYGSRDHYAFYHTFPSFLDSNFLKILYWMVFDFVMVGISTFIDTGRVSLRRHISSYRIIRRRISWILSNHRCDFSLNLV